MVVCTAAKPVKVVLLHSADHQFIKQNKHFLITLCYAKIFSDVYKYKAIIDCSVIEAQSTFDMSIMTLIRTLCVTRHVPRK